nr:hypothetical protein JVH1_3932 [Rhodococcus sp. JVH1]
MCSLEYRHDVKRHAVGGRVPLQVSNAGGAHPAAAIEDIGMSW